LHHGIYVASSLLYVVQGNGSDTDWGIHVHGEHYGGDIYQPLCTGLHDIFNVWAGLLQHPDQCGDNGITAGKLLCGQRNFHLPGSSRRICGVSGLGDFLKGVHLKGKG
jgi:hypothetical protein